MSEILRLIAGGLLALICCYIGVLIKRRYRDRVVFYSSAIDYAQAMLSELSLKKTPIPTIAQNFLSGRKGEFERVLNECSSRQNAGEGYDEILNSLRVPTLKSDEKKQVCAFLCERGKNSLKDQIAFVEYYKSLFEAKHKKCEDDNKKTGNMFFKLCVLLGIAIMLILA